MDTASRMVFCLVGWFWFPIFAFVLLIYVGEKSIMTASREKSKTGDEHARI